jgi:prophage regulatory protein
MMMNEGPTRSYQPRRILSRGDLKDRGITYSNVHLARLEAAGRFPKRVRFSASRVGWPEAEVDRWLEEKLAQRAANSGEAA